jgi:beta-galactosidase
VLDAVRLPKDPWYVNQAMWDGWVDAGGHHVHIIGHWTYPAGTVKPVEVVSNGESVELFLNGKSLGTGRRESGFLFTFDKVHFAPGELKAVATFKDGTTAEQVLTTAGKPVAIRLTPHLGPRGFVADGADLMLVDVEVVDAEGRRVPTAFNPISFDLKGPAVWKGGIAQKGGPEEAKQGSDNYVLAKTLPVELGVNRVLVRSATRAGRVHLVATSPGLKSASLDVRAHDVPVVAGLSTTFAEDFQPVDLSRGSTPAGPSYTDRLRTVPVAGIAAGSDAGTAQRSHDDNETTAWTSDGRPETAWIEYRFAKPRRVTMLSLRLTGWRLRSYPIEVTLDGRTVYRGETARSLGYVTLPLTPAVGSALRIRLTGPTTDRDAFGKIVEIKNNKVAASVGADKVPSGWRLSIVEADILAGEAR